MADKKFSELTTSAALTNDDIMAVVQMQSGALTSVKATLYAIAVHITKLAQYTSDLQTTDKTVIGAINELKRQIALIPGFNIVKVNSLPTEDIDTHTLYLVPSQDPEAQNSCDEYINTDGTTAGWELIGSTDIDLSDYYTKLEVDGLLADKLEADDFEASQTTSANPITLETKQAGLAKSCVVEMNPIQDLHGQSAPYPAGGGKNKLPCSLQDIKRVNTNGSWNGNVYTLNGSTFSVYTLPDGDTVTKITTSGTPSEITSFYVGAMPFENGVSTIMNGCPSDGSNSKYQLASINSRASGYDRGSGVTITPSATVTGAIRIYLYTEYNGNSLDWFPMIRLATVADGTFAPYENICPISGRTEASVTRTGKNQLDLADISGTETNAYYHNISTDYKLKENVTYTLSFDVQTSVSPFNMSVGVGTESGSYSADVAVKNNNSNGRVFITFTPTQEQLSQYEYLKIRLPRYASQTTFTYSIKDIQLELGSTATAYEPYQGDTYTHQYSETIYGGSDDFVNGGATSTMGMVDLGTLNWAYNSTNNFFRTDAVLGKTDGAWLISSIYTDSGFVSVASMPNYSAQLRTAGLYVKNTDYTDAASFKTAMNGVQLCYELSTPTTIQLSPEALTLLKGLNVISTDGDKVQVEFSDIPVGDYSVLLDYIKSLEARIQTLEGGGNRTLALTKNILQEEKNDIIKEEPEELELEKGQEEEKEETTEEKTDEEPEHSAESK